MILKKITVTQLNKKFLARNSTKVRSRDLHIPLLAPTLSPVNFASSCDHHFLNVIVFLNPINSMLNFITIKVFISQKSKQACRKAFKTRREENIDIGNILCVLVRKTVC